jgi:hypothetical protein
MQIMKAYIGGLQLASNPGITDPAILKTIACREALTRAEDLSIQKVCISSDCQVALGDIARGNGENNAVVVREVEVHFAILRSSIYS